VFTSGECLPTKITFIWLLSTRSALISLQICNLREIFATNITLIWLLTCVGNIMLFQDFISSKFPQTYVNCVSSPPDDSESEFWVQHSQKTLCYKCHTYDSYLRYVHDNDASDSIQMQTSYHINHTCMVSPPCGNKVPLGYHSWVEKVLQISHLSAFFWVWLSDSELKSSEWPISKQVVLLVPHFHLFWCCSLQNTINTFVTTLILTDTVIRQWCENTVGTLYVTRCNNKLQDKTI